MDLKVSVIPQAPLPGIIRKRVGDVLIEKIEDPSCREFLFAVAYMRMSGLARLNSSISGLLDRGGSISGAIGIDSKVTTVEALAELLNISSTSTIFYTTSGYIYHPKIYLMTGDNAATAVVGSANLTKDGLFRNIEFATAIEMNLLDSDDYSLYSEIRGFIKKFLDASHPNVKLISDTLIHELETSNEIGSEKDTWESSVNSSDVEGGELDPLMKFPKLPVPSAPPIVGVKIQHGSVQLSVTPTPLPPRAANTFIMQLSSFDSSHKTGTPGTPEMLVPRDALSFFPPITKGPRRYPDALFDVTLNTPTGKEVHNYRLWYYEFRKTGTRIDEHRLRMDNATIDLTTTGGGDLLLIRRLPTGTKPEYEVTILSPTDPQYSTYLAMCNRVVNKKKWGLV